MKKGIRNLLISLLLVSLVIPVYSNTAQAKERDLNANLQGYYSFDGDTVNMNTRTVQNQAPSGGYNGTLGSLANPNATSITVNDSGISGKTLRFTGNQAENYFRIPQIINSSQNYAVSAWVKLDSTSPTSGSTINLIQQTDATKTGRTLLFVKDKVLGTFIGGEDILGTNQLTYGDWMHVVVTGTKKAENVNQFQVYLNGRLEVDKSISSNLINSITDLQFGCHKNQNSGYSLNGLLDEVRIYNASADATMVQDLFLENGSEILYRQLSEKINEAQKLLSEGNIPADHKVSIALKNAKDAAKGISENAPGTEIDQALQPLIIAIANYKEEVAKLPIKISIDANNVTKEIPNYMFGTNHRYHMDSYGAWNPNTNSLYPEFKELSDSAEFGSIRYPGGIVSNLFKWKNSIGTKEQRKTTIHGNWNEPAITPHFGVDEAAKYIIDESASEMIYVYGAGNGSAGDAADLVEYLNCEVGENPNGGIDWAKVRADNGHPEPYNVKNFEIGNELDEGRGYWLQSSPDVWSDASDNCARMFAEGAERTFTKEKTAEADNWNTTNNTTKGSTYSDGTANQKKYIRYANDLSDQEDKTKIVKNVHVYVNDVEWQIVADLSKASAEDKKVQLNYETGEILFGDGIHGKIPATDADIRVTYTVYKDGISDYYDAMKVVDPTIKIYSGFASPNIAKVISNSTKAGADGGKFDGIAVHPYSRTNGQINDNDPQFYEKILDKIAGNVLPQINLRTLELNKYWPDESKNVAISEYGIFNHSGDVVQSQAHAVYIAENLMNFVDLGVAYTNKHSLIDFPGGDVLGPGKQALILANRQDDGTFKFYGTPSLNVFNIFNTMSGTQILDSTIQNNRQFYKSVNSVNVMATKDETGNIYCIVTNTERDKETEININIADIDLTGYDVEIQSLSGADVYDMNSLSEPNRVAIVSESDKVAGKSYSYRLPTHSVVGFKLTKAPEISVTDVYLDQEKVILDKNNYQIQLKAQVLPETAINKNVKWTSSNTSVATVDNNGLVAAVANGDAIITVTTEDGNFTATCVVTVKITDPVVKVESVSLDKNTLEFTKEGATGKLLAKVAPDNATNKNVKWTSSNTSVATVDNNGLVTAVANGNTIITITTEDGGLTANCLVAVKIVDDPAPGNLLLTDDLTGTTLEMADGTAFDLNVRLMVKQINDEAKINELNKKITLLEKDSKIVSLFDISLLYNNIEYLPDGKVCITLTLTNEKLKDYKKLKIISIDDDGNIVIIPSQLNGNKIKFLTDHLNYYGIIGTRNLEQVDSPEVSNPPKGTDAVVTSDNNLLCLTIFLLSISFCSIATLAILKRKREFTK